MACSNPLGVVVAGVMIAACTPGAPPSSTPPSASPSNTPSVAPAEPAAPAPSAAPAASSVPVTTPSPAPSLDAFLMRGPYPTFAQFCAELKAESRERANTVCRLTELRRSRTLRALHHGMLEARVSGSETIFYPAAQSSAGWFFAAHEAQLVGATAGQKTTLDGGWESGFVHPDGDLAFHRATFATVGAPGAAPTLRSVMLVISSGDSLVPGCIGFTGEVPAKKPLDLALPDPSTAIVQSPLERVETSPAGRAHLSPGTYRLIFK